MLPLRSSGHWFWELVGKDPQREIARGSGVASWSNLKDWLKLYHEGELPRAPHSMVKIAAWLEVVVSAFDVADAMMKIGAQWEDIEVVIGSFQKAVEVAAKGSRGPWGLATP